MKTIQTSPARLFSFIAALVCLAGAAGSLALTAAAAVNGQSATVSLSVLGLGLLVAAFSPEPAFPQD